MRIGGGGSKFCLNSQQLTPLSTNIRMKLELTRKLSKQKVKIQIQHLIVSQVFPRKVRIYFAKGPNKSGGGWKVLQKKKLVDTLLYLIYCMQKLNYVQSLTHLFLST